MTSPAIVHSAREQWLMQRRELITASDVAAILGEDERRGALSVYCDKIGAGETEETEAMARGRDFEEAIGRAYGRQTGRPVHGREPFEIVRHPSLPWLGATLDRTTAGTGEYAVPGSLQIKMALGSALAWKGDEIPLGYQVQVNVEMACFGSHWGALCALVGPGPLKVADIPRNDDFLSAAIPKLEEFLWRVKHRQPPEADALPGTTDAIRRLWPGASGTTVPLDAEAGELMAAVEAARAREGAAKKDERAALNKLAVRMVGASFGALLDGSFVKRTRVERDPYQVKETSYVTVSRWRPKRRR